MQYIHIVGGIHAGRAYAFPQHLFERVLLPDPSGGKHHSYRIHEMQASKQGNDILYFAAPEDMTCEEIFHALWYGYALQCTQKM